MKERKFLLRLVVLDEEIKEHPRTEEHMFNLKGPSVWAALEAVRQAWVRNRDYYGIRAHEVLEMHVEEQYDGTN
jgi:hypothetical protein